MSEQADLWLGLRRSVRPLVLAGTALGIGLGGLFDGIVFHQLLGWHHMLSGSPDPTVASNLPLNVFADGVFHAATYAFTVLGVVLLFRAWQTPGTPPSGRVLFGSTLLGWGLFNVVEGLVIHQYLGLHHVWPTGPGPLLLWDLLYLAWGVGFVAWGYVLARSADAAKPLTGNVDAGDRGRRDAAE